MLKAGDTAPDFTRKSTKREELSLHDYLGRKNIVLFFFPLAFTPI